MHRCSAYCTRRKKFNGVYITRCKFGFPLPKDAFYFPSMSLRYKVKTHGARQSCHRNVKVALTHFHIALTQMEDSCLGYPPAPVEISESGIENTTPGKQHYALCRHIIMARPTTRVHLHARSLYQQMIDTSPIHCYACTRCFTVPFQQFQQYVNLLYLHTI